MNPAKPTITRQGLFVMAVIALFGGLGLGRIAYGPQEIPAMTTATEYADPLQKQLDRDPRFRHVMVVPTNLGDRKHPQVRFHFCGYVKTEEDLEALHRFVEAGKPAFETAFFMDVRSKNRTNINQYYK